MARTLRRLDHTDRLLEFRRQGDWIKVAVFRVLDGRGWVRSADVLAERAIPEPPPPKPAFPKSDQSGDERFARFVLALEGTPAIGYGALCRVSARADEEERLEFAGFIPDQVTLEAGAVSCVVRKTDAFGRLRASLFAGDTEVAGSTTRAAFNWVRVRSDGPWGPAQATRGSVVVAFPKVTGSSRRGRIVVPPMGNPVPPLRGR